MVSVQAFLPGTKRPVANQLQPVFFSNHLEGWRGGLAGEDLDDISV